MSVREGDGAGGSADGAPAVVCNIAARGRRRRAGMGLVVAVAAGAAFVTLDAQFGTRWWRLGLVPLVGFAALCLFQAMEST